MPVRGRRGQSTFGWTAIGIQQAAVTAGITDIGPVHPTAEPVGSDRAMTGASSLRATGKATGAALTTTIAGIGTALATSIGIAATIVTSALASF
jgi:hypothetical protein